MILGAGGAEAAPPAPRHFGVIDHGSHKYNLSVQVTAVDLAAVVIGALFVAIGALAHAIAFSARPRVDRAAAWVGLFCVVYGVRLVASTTLVPLVTGWPQLLFRYVDASITYAILVPATLFIEALVGAGPFQLLRRTWQLLAIVAVVAVAVSIATGNPNAAMPINRPVVLVTMAVWFWCFALRSREGRWAPEVRVVVSAGAVLAAAALAKNALSERLLGDVDIEPLAMLLFAGTLGWFVLRRARTHESSFVALTRELELARTIQQSLLPKEMPPVGGVRIAARYLPMSAVAGDLYEVLPLPGGRALVVLADVSGHGVPAALVASMLKVAIAAEADRYDTPGETLTGVNRALTGKFESAYVTACCFVFDPARNTLSYAAAGHPPSLLRRADGRIERLDHGGIVLTMMAAIPYTSTDVTFSPGDRLLVYSDGLTETVRAGSDEFFGDAQLTRVLQALAPGDNMLDTVLDARERWCGGAALTDDISVVTVERLME
jgi:sigma-B regulation protein RsbU (phosphoserine phosphatase)